MAGQVLQVFSYINLSNRTVSEEVTLCHLWEDILYWVHLVLDDQWRNYRSIFFTGDKQSQIGNSTRLTNLFESIAI